MVTIEQINEFLAHPKRKGYENPEVKKIRESDGSTTIIFQDEDWKSRDNYFGGEPYGGETIIFFKERPVYMTVYYGFVEKSFKDFKAVYKFLKEALKIKSDIKRGPKKYKNGSFTYKNKFKGTSENFSGTETIYFKNKKVYTTTYAGGLVDQRKEKNA